MASPHVDQINEKRATVSASPEPIVNTVDPSMVSGGTPTAGATAYTAENGHPTDNLSRAHTASAASMRARVENTKRPPPFSRKVTKSLFIKPPSQRGVAPGYAESFRNVATYSWLNVLLLCNPVAWALHYTNQTAGATFALALLGVIPLAGLLGHGTEAIALYTGDALGGLINASLGNATEFIIAILLLTKCEIRVVQASLLGGLLSNLLLVLGMAFLVGGFRFSEQEFQQTAAQLNTSLMTLAVISLVIPSAFAYALESTVPEEQEREIILEMSRGSSIILIFIYISYMVFQLYSHSHYYNPDVDLASEVPSRSSSRSSSSARVGGYDGATPTAHDVIPTPAAQAPTMSPRIPGVSGSVRERMGVRRAHSMPFGSAARLGFGQRAPAKRGSLPQGARGRAPPVTPGQAIAATAHSQHQNSNAMRRREYFDRRDVEIAVPKDEDSDSEDEGPEDPELNIPVALGTLLAATGLTYLTAEALTDSLETIGETSGVTKEWLGLILLAVVGNAAEHVTAVFVAYRNKVDLALAVSVGSCIQISLFVIPALVLIGWAAGKPLSLLFDPLETVTLFLSVLLVRFATEDGRTHYMSGVALVSTYILIAFAFWYYPSSGTTAANLFDQC